MVGNICGAVILKLLFAVFLTGLAASPALANRNPIPPPSGVVIHLFGANSVTSQLVPSQSTASPSVEAVGAAQGANTATQATPEPTLGGILHQMFVTGDPDKNTPNFPPGRGSTF